MLKPEQVPKEAVDAYIEAAMDQGLSFRGALAAAINAWPGMYTDPEREYGAVVGYTIFLPIQKEPGE